jgi:hypothetical protein
MGGREVGVCVAYVLVNTADIISYINITQIQYLTPLKDKNVFGSYFFPSFHHMHKYVYCKFV